MPGIALGTEEGNALTVLHSNGERKTVNKHVEKFTQRCYFEKNKAVKVL